MKPTVLAALSVTAALTVLAPCAAAGPDLITSSVGLWFPDATGVKKWGSENGVTGYSYAAFSCNIGDANLPWNGFSDQHPVLAQNLYRLHEGRLDMIGAGPVKHVVATVPQDLFCSNSCSWPGSFELGVGCSDPYDADRNGEQIQLGPRSEINPVTGAVPFPFTSQNVTGGVLDKRVRVRNADLDPANYPGARFFVEGQYMSESDTIAGNQFNNSGYREVTVGAFADGGYDLVPVGDAVGEATVLDAWRTADPGVTLASIDAPGDGRFTLASRATDNGDGSWHYEYALLNYNSDRAAGSFSVPLGGCAPANPAFHAPGLDPVEQVTPGDWTLALTAQTASWSTDAFLADPDAKALTWGMVYSFRFDAPCGPETGAADIGLFRPGTPASVQVGAVVPAGAGCVSEADLAPPAGVLDLADVQAFVNAFVGGDPMSDPSADLAPPAGVLDLADLQAFIGAFVAGCP